MLTMSHSITIRKLMFYYHLKHLPSNALASEILRVQEHLSLPGLAKECMTLGKIYDLPQPDKLSKLQWKTIVKRRVRITCRKELLAQAQNLSKMDNSPLEKEDLNLKDYVNALNVPDARLRFAIRTKMTRTIKMNFKGIKAYAKSHWQCDNCNLPDTQEHVMSCKTYRSYRVGKDLARDKDIVDYFRNVLRSTDCSGT